MFCCIRVLQNIPIRSLRFEFKKRFNRKPPTRQRVRAWKNSFLERGSVLRKPGSGRPRIGEELADEVRDFFSNDPESSIRRASKALVVPLSSIHKILHSSKFKAYKIQVLHELRHDDYAARSNFAHDMLSRLESDSDFLSKIVFTDEATFHISGQVNTHNCRIWATEKPDGIRENVRGSPKVNAWCGIARDRILGPHFFTGSTVTADAYLQLLDQHILPHIRAHEYLQQDGAPPHWGLTVRNLLNQRLGQRWIGRSGPIVWPPRSPDLTPMDFFAWGYIKNKVYAQKIADLNDLKAKIQAASQLITQEMLKNVWENLQKRLELIKENGGSHVEKY